MNNERNTYTNPKNKCEKPKACPRLVSPPTEFQEIGKVTNHINFFCFCHRIQPRTNLKVPKERHMVATGFNPLNNERNTYTNPQNRCERPWAFRICFGGLIITFIILPPVSLVAIHVKLLWSFAIVLDWCPHQPNFKWLVRTPTTDNS